MKIKSDEKLKKKNKTMLVDQKPQKGTGNTSKPKNLKWDSLHPAGHVGIFCYITGPNHSALQKLDANHVTNYYQ